MRFDWMDVPKTRSEFERNLFLLIEQMSRGRLHLPSDVRILKQFEQVRRLPNGRVNLLTISEIVRLQANMIPHMQDLLKRSPELSGDGEGFHEGTQGDGVDEE